MWSSGSAAGRVSNTPARRMGPNDLTAYGRASFRFAASYVAPTNRSEPARHSQYLTNRPERSSFRAEVWASLVLDPSNACIQGAQGMRCLSGRQGERFMVNIINQSAELKQKPLNSCR